MGTSMIPRRSHVHEFNGAMKRTFIRGNGALWTSPPDRPYGIDVADDRWGFCCNAAFPTSLSRGRMPSSGLGFVVGIFSAAVGSFPSHG